LVIKVQDVVAQEICYAELDNATSQRCYMKDIPNNYFNNQHYANVKQLRMISNKIETLRNSTFNGLAELETLDLDGNQISDLPYGVYKPLKSIKQIVLSHNKLTNVKFDRFSSNRNLQELHLEHNSIEIIQPIHNEGAFSITTLWLNDNKLVTISELCKLTDLTVLSLSNNPNLDFGSFNFSCWSELKVLHLQNTNLASLGNDYRTFAGLTTLYYLNLKKNGLKFLCVVNFPELPALKYLLVDDNKLRTLNGTELITKFKNIQAVYMFGNLWDCGIVNELNHSNFLMILEPKVECVNYTLPEQMNETDGCKYVPQLSNLTSRTSRSDKNKANDFNYSGTSVFFVTFVVCGLTIDLVISYLAVKHV
jgi:Leucine-rich repeat (LRR) protein